MTKRNTCELCLPVVVMLLLAIPSSLAAQLPDPDGKPADMSKPVQVYILLGQSNMLGFGKVKGGGGSLVKGVPFFEGVSFF